MSWLLRVASTTGNAGEATTVFVTPDAAPEVWVMRYDPDAERGVGYVETTGDRARARRFDSVNDAIEYWRQQSTVLPLRPDGKPNRPLTSWWIILERDKAATA